MLRRPTVPFRRSQIMFETGTTHGHPRAPASCRRSATVHATLGGCSWVLLRRVLPPPYSAHTTTFGAAVGPAFLARSQRHRGGVYIAICTFVIILDTRESISLLLSRGHALPRALPLKHRTAEFATWLVSTYLSSARHGVIRACHLRSCNACASPGQSRPSQLQDSSSQACCPPSSSTQLFVNMSPSSTILQHTVALAICPAAVAS